MLTTQLQTFQTTTDTNSKVKGRGTQMKKVDDALRAYWLSIATADAGTEIGLLSNLVVACKTWLQAKYSKNEYTRGRLGQRTNYYNQLFLTRRTEVTRLGNEALAELSARMQAHGVASAADLARLRFDSRKMTALGTQQSNRRNLRALGTSYTAERTTYVQSGKQRAIPGSGVHKVHEILSNPTSRSEIENGMMGGRRLDRKYLKVLGKDVDSLSAADYRLYDEMAKAAKIDDLGSYGEMNYLKKNDRLQFMAIPGANGTLCDINGQPITTDPNLVTAYAMDRYGNLFLKDAEPLNGAWSFNHSSFNCGHDVIAAGIIQINNGVLTKLTNESGHYKPGHEHIYNCVDLLAADQVDLSQAVICVWKWPGPQEHRYTAARMLSGSNAVADIGVF